MPVLGLGFAQAPKPLDSDALAQAIRPWLAPCIDAFGPARCMFESNFPVDRGAGRYKVWWNAIQASDRGLLRG